MEEGHTNGNGMKAAEGMSTADAVLSLQLVEAVDEYEKLSKGIRVSLPSDECQVG